MIIAQVWHYWLAIVLLLAAVGAVLQGLVGYAVKISAQKYPNRRQRKIRTEQK